jgi:hypothetical protein
MRTRWNDKDLKIEGHGDSGICGMCDFGIGYLAGFGLIMIVLHARVHEFFFCFHYFLFTMHPRNWRGPSAALLKLFFHVFATSRPLFEV